MSLYFLFIFAGAIYPLSPKKVELAKLIYIKNTALLQNAYNL